MKGGRGRAINACSSQGRVGGGGKGEGGGRGKEGPQDSQQLPALPWETGNAYSRPEGGIAAFLDHCQ